MKKIGKNLYELNGKQYQKSDARHETCKCCAFYDNPHACSISDCDGHVFKEYVHKPKVYISGKVTGLPINVARKMFSDAEDKINATGKYEAVNPLKDEKEGYEWEYYMRKDIKLLMDCEYIHFLPNWQESRGANLEMIIARQLGIQTLIF